MADPLSDRYVVLGVTGSIACYKAVDLASRLVKAGAQVDVVMTAGATKFVTPLCFGAITHRPVVDDLWDPEAELAIEHVGLAKRADAVLIAPATANTIAKLSLGLAEDALQTTVLDTRAPIVIAPAMEHDMYSAPATQEHIARLAARGVTFVEPEEGRLASGLTGRGRLADPEVILGTLRQVLARGGDLAGRRIVVSAGGTQEPIDPVRIITNRSSGKMGYAIAEAARDRGAQVTLIATPTASALTPPFGTDLVRVETVIEMHEAVKAAMRTGDVLIMAAAVADYRVANPANQKIKKRGAAAVRPDDRTRRQSRHPGRDARRLRPRRLRGRERGPARQRHPEARKKRLDLIVANDITGEGSGFGSDTNRVVLIGARRQRRGAADPAKREVADAMLDRVAALVAERRG